MSRDCDCCVSQTYTHTHHIHTQTCTEADALTLFCLLFLCNRDILATSMKPDDALQLLVPYFWCFPTYVTHMFLSLLNTKHTYNMNTDIWSLYFSVALRCFSKFDLFGEAHLRAALWDYLPVFQNFLWNNKKKEHQGYIYEHWNIVSCVDFSSFWLVGYYSMCSLSLKSSTAYYSHISCCGKFTQVHKDTRVDWTFLLVEAIILCFWRREKASLALKPARIPLQIKITNIKFRNGHCRK